MVGHGTITLTQAVDYDTLIFPVINELKSGHWYSAYQLATPIVVGLEVQSLHTRILDDMKDYVNANYPSELTIP